jgi:hypothetical protein
LPHCTTLLTGSTIFLDIYGVVCIDVENREVDDIIIIGRSNFAAVEMRGTVATSALAPTVTKYRTLLPLFPHPMVSM